MGTRKVMVAVLIALGVLVLAPLLAMPMGWGMMGMGGGGAMGLVLLVILGLGIILLLRREDIDVGLLSGSPSRQPLDIAKSGTLAARSPGSNTNRCAGTLGNETPIPRNAAPDSSACSAPTSGADPS